MKRSTKLAVLAALMALPGVIFAADRVAPASVNAVTGNTVTVPLVIANQDGLMAMDIPLSFSEGVTLKAVTFEGTRSEYFDLKLSNINNEKNQVIIGLISQATGTRKPELEAGEGAVANLVFTVDNPSITEITISPVKLENPNHSLTFIYRADAENGSTMTRVEPRYDGTVVALGSVAGNLPTKFEVAQNYPNPFNPTTEISFGLPTAGPVEVSVYNLLGQKVSTLVDQEMPAGVHVVTWDGTNSNGGSVASGVYFYRVVAGSNIETKKMMLIK